MRAIHLTPRGVVTNDAELFEQITEYLRKVGVQFEVRHEGIWHKCDVKGVKGGDLMMLMKEFARGYRDVEVWLYFTKIYSPEIVPESGSARGDLPP